MAKEQAMALRINVLQYNGFVFRQQLSFLWGETGPIHVALVGLTAGWQTRRWAVAEFWNLCNSLTG